jgi:hypothetical protein
MLQERYIPLCSFAPLAVCAISPARQFASPTRVVDFVNYGSSLYSELQGGCGRWRFYLFSIIYYFLSLIFCFLREDDILPYKV